MVAILLQWMVLDQIAHMYHKSVLMRSDNTPACSWATKMSMKLAIAACLIRVIALRQRICQAVIMTTLHVVGRGKYHCGHSFASVFYDNRWNEPNNLEFLTYYSSTFQLEQGACWKFFVINPNIVTRASSEFLTKQLTMDLWQRLPKDGDFLG